MKLFGGQLTLLKRGTCNTDKASHYIIAAWHKNNSVTWRWLLWWWPFHKYSFRTRLIGTFLFSKQDNLIINH